MKILLATSNAGLQTCLSSDLCGPVDKMIETRVSDPQGIR